MEAALRSENGKLFLADSLAYDTVPMIVAPQTL